MFRSWNPWFGPNPPGKYGGIAVSDVDGDGTYELLIARGDGANRVLKFAGGMLRDISSPVISDAERATLEIIPADIDSDGTEELYLISSPESGADRLLKRGLDGSWFDLLERPEHQLLAGWNASSAAAVDRRGSGRYGLSLTHPTQPPRFLELGPDRVLADRFRSIGSLQRDLGGGRATSEFGPLAALLDVNGDGLLDLFVGHAESAHQMLVRQQDESWRDKATPSLAFPSSLAAAVAADFDNDGCEELFLANRGERNRLFRVAQDVEMLDAGDAAEPESLAACAAVADLDGDGIVELIVSHEHSAPAAYKSRVASGNAWLRVRPLTRFGAPARGAFVTASVPGRTLVRCIDFRGEPVAHFGLGREPRVEWVRVTWPDGESLRLPEPDINCTYSVPYPRG